MPISIGPGFSVGPGWALTNSLPTSPGTVEYLVVAGGGGGASRYGAGGGAGGYLTASDFPVTGATSYTVTVGAGGTAGTNTAVYTGGTDGTSSVFSSITSTGGGGVNTAQTGRSGGSGGGGSGGNAGGAGNTPSTSPSQGNTGGGSTGGLFTGGGGGGAGAVGATAGANAGNGGVGVSDAIIPNYSILFNGSTDYLTVAANAAFQLGTGSYTFETWIYPTSLGVVNKNNIINIGTYITGLMIRGNGTTTGLEVYTLNTQRLATTTGLTANAWQHIALVRNGTACTLYINGAVNGTFTDSSNISPATATLTIGRALHNSGEYFTGYMSNYRLVKGTAVYTTVFAVPTPPLSAITNTSLLTAQSSTIVDNSVNGFTITSGGSPSVSSSVTPPVYAGGGGGGKFAAASAGVGGAGGGGGGSSGGGSPITGSAGTVNTGGGGGGGSDLSGGFNGGSGIVILAYADTGPNLASVDAGLTCNGSAGNTTPDTISRAGYKIYKFTAGTGNISW